MKIIAVDDDGKEITLPPADSIVDFIKKNRQKLHMSLQDIGKVIGVKRQAVWSWEQGKTIPTVENLVMLVKAFGQKGTPRPEATKPEPAKATDMNANLKLAEEILGA